MKKIAFLITLFVLTITVNAQSQERSLSNFTAINISSAFDVELVNGGESKVLIEGIPEEYLENIITEVTGDVLKVYVKGKVKNAKKMHLTITYQKINAIEVSGASDVRAKEMITSNNFTITTSGASSLDIMLTAEEVNLTTSGASDIKMEGTSPTFKTALSGASSLNAKAFIANKVSVNASGASDVNVYASQGVSGVASGASDVNVFGNPSVNKFKKSGAADINIEGQ